MIVVGKLTHSLRGVDIGANSFAAYLVESSKPRAIFHTDTDVL